MGEQSAAYLRLLERVVSAARRARAQLGQDQPAGEYTRALGEALCDDNLAFAEVQPGTVVVEKAVAANLGSNPDELRAYLASSGLAAGVWLDFGREVLGVERVWRQTGVLPPAYPIFPEASVLVAVMTRRRDFELARDEGWYRIPVRSAPKFFPPDYLAFYFTKAFREHAFSVCYYAPVRGHELLTRRDLLPAEPDHPRAGQRYYKVQLSPLIRREPPIVSVNWRRISFILTNGRRFTDATEINELVLGPKEHDILWRALKECGLHAERNYVIRDEQALYKADLAVLCQDGAVGILCSEAPAPKPAAQRGRRPGGPWLHFTPEQVESGLEECLAAVQEAAGQLGGASVTQEPSFS
ncbi:MAG: hypothetical protein JW850_07090 [Thermoflexales bacterium]|nr:hypothetical protein [Thermoflexales bacterium]